MAATSPTHPTLDAMGRGKSSPARLDWVTWLLVVVLGIIVAVTFFGVVKGAFLEIDDETFAYGNKHVVQGLTPRNIAWAGVMIFGDWTPLFWISLELDGTLTRLILGPMPAKLTIYDPLPSAAVFHAHSLVLHVLGAGTLFLFLRKATGNLWGSFIAVLLWAVHPLRVESVAWVTELKDVQAGLFGFSAMYFYVVWRERGRGIWYGLSCCAMALSVMTKPTFLTLPLILLVVDFWPLGRLKSWRDLGMLSLEKWPLFVIGVIRLIISDYFIRGSEMYSLTWGQQITNALYAYVRCMWTQVDFRSLTIFYPVVELTIFHAVGAIAMIAAISALCLWQRRQRPWLLAGWIWCIIALTPVAGFVQLFHHAQAYADRFTYLPSIGVAVMLAFLIPESWLRKRAGLTSVLAGTTAIAGLLIYFTVAQIGYWKDTQTLFERNVAIMPPEPFQHLILGRTYWRAGRLDDAFAQYQEFARLEPKSEVGLVQMAFIYLRQNKLELALPLAKQAEELNPRNVEARSICAMALVRLERYNEARQEYEILVALAPDDAVAQRNLELCRSKIDASLR